MLMRAICFIWLLEFSDRILIAAPRFLLDECIRASSIFHSLDSGYLRRDPTKNRAIEVHWDAGSGAVIDRRPVTHVPLVGDVAAGSGVAGALASALALASLIESFESFLRIFAVGFVDALHVVPRLVRACCASPACFLRS